MMFGGFHESALGVLEAVVGWVDAGLFNGIAKGSAGVLVLGGPTDGGLHRFLGGFNNWHAVLCSLPHCFGGLTIVLWLFLCLGRK